MCVLVRARMYFHAEFKVRHRKRNNHISLLYDNQTLLVCIFLKLETLNLHTECVRISTASNYFRILLYWKEMCLNHFRHSKCTFVRKKVTAWTTVPHGIKVVKCYTCIQNIEGYSLLRLRKLIVHNPIDNLTLRQMILQTLFFFPGVY